MLHVRGSRVRLCALVVAVAAAYPATAATAATQTYWGTSTAQHVLTRFWWVCSPHPACYRRVGLILPNLKVVLAPGGKCIKNCRSWPSDVVNSVHCTGISNAVFDPRWPRTPLYARHLCRMDVERYSARGDPQGRRNIWVYLHALGPPNVDQPDAPHHFTIQLAPTP
jgi:hypothetical protein